MTFFIETYGCQMNKADSANIIDSLKKAGFTYTNDIKKARTVIINTCSVRKSAENRIWGRLGYFKRLAQEQDLTVMIVGCMSQRIGQSFLESAYTVDIVVGTFFKFKIPEILLNYRKGQKLCFINEDDYRFYASSPDSTNSMKAFVTISHGCNNFCTYCIVPYVRGREISRSSDEIIEDIRELTAKGVAQVTLLGQNVNSYGTTNDDISFPQLLARIAAETDIKWIKFMSSHPKDFTDSLIDEMVRNDKVSNQLHLAVQSGSNKILEKMNRNYTIESYIEKVQSLRKRVPGLNLTTDIIVGFPGETETDYQDTLSLMRTVQFDDAYMYKYNIRENTVAQKQFEDDVDDEEKLKRLSAIIDLQRQISLANKEKRIGSVFEVIPEKWSKNSTHQILGLTKEDLMVLFEGTEDDFGRVLSIKSTGISGSTLYGEKI